MQRNKNASIMNTNNHSCHSLRRISAVLMLLFAATTMAMAQETYAVRTVKVGNFSAIDCNTPVKVYFEQGSKQDVKVRDAKNNTLVLTVKDGTLKIRREKKTANSVDRATVWITAPNLTAIDNNAVLSFNSEKISGKRLSLNNSGSANFYIRSVDVGDYRLKNNGASRCKGSVKAKTVAISNDGAANDTLTIDASTLTMENDGSFKGTIGATATATSFKNDGSATARVTIDGGTVNFENDGVYKGGVKVTATSLTMKNDGSGIMNIDFKGGDMSIDNDGSVKTTLHVDCQRLKVHSSGVAKLTITGTADDTNITSDGSAKVDTSGLNKF